MQNTREAIEMDKTPQQLYEERAKRVEDAIQLKEPDRVPVVLSLGYFPAKYTGITCADAFYNPAKWKEASIKTVMDFAPDACTAMGPDSGKALDALDFKQMLWPGGGGSPYHTHQFVENEYMKADEYDAFLKDPTGFILNTYLPRTCGKLESFKRLPNFSILLFSPMMLLSIPAFDEAIQALSTARQEIAKRNAAIGSMGAELEQLGFPTFAQSVSFAPFDVVSDRLRGMRGIMMDMFRQPERIIEMSERFLPVMIGLSVAMAKMGGNSRVFIPLHRGADGFMSIKQFEKFYWPTLKGLMMGLIDAGLTPCPFFEGKYDSRLEHLLELPRGKVLGYFDASDIFKVKQILGNHLCIMGNVPPSLLQTGNPQDIRDHCKKLIDVVGKGGGFIMAPRSAIDEVKPENLKEMIDFTKEYGVYK
jgi:uroporphyrinogen-III decarboxylase